MSYIPPFKRSNNIYEVLNDNNNIIPQDNSNSNNNSYIDTNYKKNCYRNYNNSNSNMKNRINKYNIKRKSDEIYSKEFVLDQDTIQKEFPSIKLDQNLQNTNNIVFNYEDLYIDMLKKEKIIVPIIVEEVKNDVKTIVNRYKDNLVPFEERTYDENGWMTNDDWLEYYMFHNRF